MKTGKARHGLTVFLALSALIALGLSLSCAHHNHHSGDSVKAPDIELWVVTPPTPAEFRENVALGYELHMSDYESLGYTLAKVDILADSASGDVVKTYEGLELADCVIPFNAERPTPGAWLAAWPEFDTLDKVPAALYHKVYFKDGAGRTRMVEGALTEVSTTPPMLVSPPVAGDNWWAAAGPSNLDIHHRRVLMTVQDVPYISQRFAVDWLKLGPDGRVFANDGAVNEDYYCYGAEVLAVADATVVDAKDGFPEQAPNDPMPVQLSPDNIAGNYIILDLGNKRYASYAHIIPGTVQVAVGDHVSAGQVLGHLGTSGNSTGPHLHFQITDNNTFLWSQGLPYLFGHFTYLGNIDDQDAMADGGTWTPTESPIDVTDKFFNGSDVVNF